MKKFTLMILAALVAVASYAAGPKRQIVGQPFTAAKAVLQPTQLLNAKPAPEGLALKAAKKSAKKMRSPKKVATGETLAGSYTWDYVQAPGVTLQLDTMETTAASSRISIKATEREDSVIISGMGPMNDLYALTGSDEELGDFIAIPYQVAYVHPQVGNCSITGFFYYEGDETYEEGWYYGNAIYGSIGEDGVITLEEVFINITVDEGTYAGATLLSSFYAPGSTFSPADPLAVVEVPEGLEVTECIITYQDRDGNELSHPLYVSYQGTDVYVKGFATYLPEAWVQGSINMADKTVVFPAGQYFGNYAERYDMFLNSRAGEDVVFDLDINTMTFTQKNEYFLVDNSDYNIDWYASAVAKPVVEKAAMPANPEITTLENGNYGWYFYFNVPVVDVDGEGLISSKLSYMIYTDIEGEIAPLTFTPETHTKLTEAMTEIPYGFTENYDIYSDAIYLNDLYSADWNNLGIQSIYRGGDEENKTEIQWFHIKDYATAGGEYTFNFNAMDVPTSSSASTEGDITEAIDITEGSITLTISPKDETASTANRFWGTKNGPQLRVYSGTLTFTTSSEAPITKIDFSDNGKWNEGNAADSGEFDGAVWTGEAQTVVITIAGNSQINSIVVTGGGSSEPVVEPELVTLPEGVESEDYTLNITQYAYASSGWQSVSSEGTAQVAFDGADVYVSGLAYWFKDAFVKGQLTATGQVVFKNGQLVGEDEYGKEYLVGSADDGETVSDFVFDYDAEARTLTLAEGYTLFETDSPTETSAYTYTTAAVYTPGAYVLPEVVELPEGAEVETWYLSATDADEAAVNSEVGVAFVGDDIYVQGLCSYLPEAWLKGTIADGIATFASGQFYGTYREQYNLFFVAGDGETGEALESATFDYDAENGLLSSADAILLSGNQGGTQLYDYYLNTVISREKGDSFPVEAPEGLETETWLFSANELIYNDDEEGGEETGFARRAFKAEGDAADVTFDFNAMDVATSTNETTDGDITEERTLTVGNVTLTVSPKEEGNTTENRFWGTNNGPQLRVYSGTLTFEVPEGCSMTQIVFNAGKWNANNSADSGEFDAQTWTGDAQSVVVTIGGNTQLNSIVVTVSGESGEEPVEPVDPEQPELSPYTYQTQVGFDGQDVYFKGFSSNTADLWAKGTLSEDGTTVTIPANQYMGQISFFGYTFDYYLTAVGEDGESMEDIVLTFDAEAQKFTTDQVIAINGAKDSLYYYQMFTDVTITKMLDYATTPADPVLESCDLKKDAGYNTIYASVPTVDIDGNELMTSKLFYIVWIEKDGKEQPYTFTAALYSNDFDEDMTEIPYSYDGYDIYSGGEIIYLEEDPAELATWTKVGIQSVYYGGGERNTSAIVWYDTLTDGISSMTADSGKNAVVYDLQGRRVTSAKKGLYIVNGKKMVLK